MLELNSVTQQDIIKTEQSHRERKSYIDKNEISVLYQGDTRRYLEKCSATGQSDGIEFKVDYLYIPLSN